MYDWSSELSRMTTEHILFAVVIMNFILSVITLFVRHKGVKVSEKSYRLAKKKLLEETETEEN